MKFTAAFVTAAHAAAKQITDATLKYAKKLGQAMKQLIAAAKAPVEEVIEIVVGYGKAAMPATYKQFNHIMDLDNVLSVAGLNATQFQKRVNVYEASQAIGLAKGGKKVRFVLD